MTSRSSIVRDFNGSTVIVNDTLVIPKVLDASSTAPGPVGSLVYSINNDQIYVSDGVNYIGAGSGLTPPLISISNLTTVANETLYTIAPDTYDTTPLTAQARVLLAQPSTSSQRSALGVAPGDGLSQSGTSLDVNVGTGLQISGSNAIELITPVPLSIGGTGVTSFTTGNKLVATNSGNTGLVATTISPSDVVELVGGNLELENQGAVLFFDNDNSNYVGISAPPIVNTNYILAFPGASPLGGQILRTNTIVPTNLEWITESPSADPSQSRSIYVAKYGNDTTGNGSFSNPYLTVAKAVELANTLSSASDPISIIVEPGIYVEDNSGSPIIVTSEGISFVGGSPSSIFIQPSTLSNDLMLATATTQINYITLQSGGVSTARGLVVSGVTNQTTLSNCNIDGFDTGVYFQDSSVELAYKVNTCSFTNNNIGIYVSNAICIAGGGVFVGVELGDPAGIGVFITGSQARFAFETGIISKCDLAVHAENECTANILGVTCRLNNRVVNCVTGAQVFIQATSIEPFDTGSVIETPTVLASDIGSSCTVTSCLFNGVNLVSGTNCLAVSVSTEAIINIVGGQIQSYTTGLHVGQPGDTISTQLTASGLSILNCVTDVVQEGSSLFSLSAGVATSTNMSINDPSNVNVAFFDPTENNSLHIGTFADVETSLVHIVDNTSGGVPFFNYKPDLYSSDGLSSTLGS